MTQQELEKREAALQEAGYHKSRNTSSTNDYSWFKTIRDPDPYSIQPCIIVNLPDAVRLTRRLIIIKENKI